MIVAGTGRVFAFMLLISVFALWLDDLFPILRTPSSGCWFLKLLCIIYLYHCQVLKFVDFPCNKLLLSFPALMWDIFFPL